MKNDSRHCYKIDLNEFPVIVNNNPGLGAPVTEDKGHGWKATVYFIQCGFLYKFNMHNSSLETILKVNQIAKYGYETVLESYQKYFWAGPIEFASLKKLLTIIAWRSKKEPFCYLFLLFSPNFWLILDKMSSKPSITESHHRLFLDFCFNLLDLTKALQMCFISFFHRFCFKGKFIRKSLHLFFKRSVFIFILLSHKMYLYLETGNRSSLV